MNRIMVIGCPGSGKSRLSIALHQRTGIPLYHLDMMYWNADRTTVDKAEFRRRLREVLETDEWIIDGNYGSTMEMRLQACDTVIFLDYPVEVCLDGVRARRGKPRPDMPWIEGENEEDPEFIDFIRRYREESRPRVLELLRQYRDREIHVFLDRSAADELLARL